MKRLWIYFREKPARIVHALTLLAVLCTVSYGTAFQVMQAEIFAKVVRDPDHRMQASDKHFSGLNSDNIRSTHEGIDIKDSDFNIVFLGDSFIYGFLMPEEKSPPAQLENILRERFHRNDINVINFGWTSSSPYLDLRLLKDIGKKYKPDLVLLALDMSDYRDEWFYRGVIEQRGFYHFVVQYPRLASWLKNLLEWIAPAWDAHKLLFGYSGTGGYFVARQPLEKSQHLFDAIYETLLAIHEYSSQELHVPLAVFVPPRHWQYTDKEAPDTWERGSFDALGPYALENFRYFDDKKSTAPFPLITMLEDFRQTDRFPLNFQKDSHWNKHGAQFFAERVAAHCEQLGLLKSLGEFSSTTVLEAQH